MRWVITFLLISSYLSSDVSYWNHDMVRSYVHYSELQRRWAWSFLAPHLKEIPADAKILDIGCGDGKITADMARFIPKGSILGIDSSNSMLEWARKQYHFKDYPNLRFKNGDFLKTDILDHFDLIVSFCALQHCTDLKGALSQIAQILNPSGKVLILVPAMNNQAWNQARAKVQASPKWAPYWQEFRPRTFLSVEQYEDLFKDTGLHIAQIDNIQTMDPFIDRNEMLDWLEGTFPPVVPKDLAREFYREWIAEYLRSDPQSIDERGTIYAKFGFIGIEAVPAKF